MGNCVTSAFPAQQCQWEMIQEPQHESLPTLLSRAASQLEDAAWKDSNVKASTTRCDADLIETAVDRSLSEKEDLVLVLFKKLDANGDGVLSREEMESAMRRLKTLGDHRMSRLDELMSSIDTSGDGLLQFEEFLAWCVAADDGWEQFRWACFKRVRRQQSEGCDLSKWPSSNNNRISEFSWLHEVLEMIVRGAAEDAVKDLESKRQGRPLFVVAGACPNSLCGMQALLFSHFLNDVNFWWLKPTASDSQRLEQKTLDMHSSGPHRNTPGKSKGFFQPLAEKFRGQSEGDFSFGVDADGRAYIDETENGVVRRLFIYFVWQEKWSSFFACKKFIEGKLFYQRSDPVAGEEGLFFARQYRLEGGQLTILGSETEESHNTILPPDSLQDLWSISS